MNDSAFFQGMSRAWGLGGQPASPWPMTAWQSLFECPIAVSSHLQQFLAHRVQEQARFLAELSHERNPNDILAKQMSYLQQAAMAWSTEMIQVGEIAQSRLMGAASGATAGFDIPEPRYARAA